MQEPVPNFDIERYFYRGKRLRHVLATFLQFCACFLKHPSHAAKNFRSHGQSYFYSQLV
jgi:hypothetical protein